MFRSREARRLTLNFSMQRGDEEPSSSCGGPRGGRIPSGNGRPSRKTTLSLAAVSDLLVELGVEAYLVGGYVRDLLLSRESADVDIAVRGDALPVARQIADRLSGEFVPLDEPNQIARVVLALKGRSVCVDFSGYSRSIEADLARRDFTIDAMAVDISRWRDGGALAGIIDPYGGRADLEARRLRAVREDALREDPVRMLRAIRLAGELGLDIESGTEELIRQGAPLVSGVAGERVHQELVRIFSVCCAARLVSRMYDLGLLLAVFPELAPAKDFEQKGVHVWDVLTHSRNTVAAAEYLIRQGDWQFGSEEVRSQVKWSGELESHFAAAGGGLGTRATMLRIAALFHDVGKPQTKTVLEDGRWHFYEHARIGASIARTALERLRFSSREVGLVEIEVLHHLRPAQMTQGELPSRRAVYRYFRDARDVGTDVLFLALADYLATHGPNLDMAQWVGQARLMDCVLEEHWRQEAAVVPVKLIDGHDMMKSFGLQPGPRLGKLRAALREAQAAGEVNTRKEALAFVARQLGTDEATGEVKS